MASSTQRKATAADRQRATARGLARVELRVPSGDAGLLKAVAETLRKAGRDAQSLREKLEEALSPPQETALDVFGSDLPDEAFDGLFDQPRPQDWREADL